MGKLPSIPWWDKIKNKLIISIDLAFSIALIIFGFVCLSYFRTDTIKQISSKNVQLATPIATKINLFIDTIKHELFSLTNSLEEQEDWEYAVEELQSILDHYLKKMSDINYLSLFDNTGKERLTVFKKPPDIDNIWLSKSHANKITFQGDLFISSVYQSSQVVSMIDISMPIRNPSNHQINGVIKAGVSIHGLWEIISSTMRADQETTLYLIDKNGKLIAHSEIEGMVSSNIDFSHIQKVKEFKVEKSESQLMEPSIYYGNKNTRVMGVLIPIEAINWGIVMEEPLDKALSSYNRLQKLILSVLAGLILLVNFTTLLLVNKFTRSIDNLTQQAREALSEEGSPRKIEINSKDEIGHLAGIINHMQKQLWEKNENLKRRHKELEAINHEFKESYDELEQVSEKLEFSQFELDKKREFEKQLIETANGLIVVLNQRGDIIIFNKKCEEITGYSKNEAMAKNWFQFLISPEERENCLELFKTFCQKRTSFSFECSIMTKNGQRRTISWHCTFMTDEEQSLININIGEDVTEKKSLQQELENKNVALEEKNEELQNFVSIVSHDLKSPLYILQDFTSILLHDHKNEFGEDVIYYLERIKKNAENMEKLIVDILEFSKIGTVEGEYQEYPIGQIVQRAVEEFTYKINEKNIHVVIAESFPTVLCDPNRILQIFMNLISNSIKFMSPGQEGVIEIGWYDKKVEYEFFVKDNGIGIEKEYHEKVFKIFQRLKEAKDVEGNGVGLAIVKKIVEAHGGRIWVNSQKGGGSTFYFTLSASKHSEQNNKPSFSSLFM